MTSNFQKFSLFAAFTIAATGLAGGGLTLEYVSKDKAYCTKIDDRTYALITAKKPHDVITTIHEPADARIRGMHDPHVTSYYYNKHTRDKFSGDSNALLLREYGDLAHSEVDFKNKTCTYEYVGEGSIWHPVHVYELK